MVGVDYAVRFSHIVQGAKNRSKSLGSSNDHRGRFKQAKGNTLFCMLVHGEVEVLLFMNTLRLHCSLIYPLPRVA